MNYQKYSRRFVLLACVFIGALTNNAFALENNVPLENISNNQGSEIAHTLEVPANATNLSFEISGGSGDADLYVRYGSAPTTSNYDCRPYLDGNQETCSVNVAQEGTYHVMVFGYRAYNGLRLVASYDDDLTSDPPGTDGTSDNPIGLEKGVTLNNLSDNQNAATYYVLPLISDVRDLKIAISRGSGDADIYVRYNQIPTTTQYDCRPYRSGNNESCDFADAIGGDYYVMLQGYTAFADVQLRVNYDDGTSPDPDPDPSDCLNAVQQELLNAHNAARAQSRSCGEQFFSAAPALQWSCELGQAATNHSNDMATTGIFSHTGSDGSSAGTRISDMGYSWRTWAENIAAGQNNVDSVMQGWLNSPGHCRNIMDVDVTEVGAALVEANVGSYPYYWTAVFARPQ